MKVIRVRNQVKDNRRLIVLACGCRVTRPIKDNGGKFTPFPDNIKCVKHEANK